MRNNPTVDPGPQIGTRTTLRRMKALTIQTIWAIESHTTKCDAATQADIRHFDVEKSKIDD